ncbi:hypothetical protein CHS0354_042671 [Potamilus streckersoni]|uniref:C2 domain-containing protein n=1 Tax=Potamilus streckersoni TaxID=2493646 RepID=A0AAE0TEU5_9BIVA|nr:hypothetical protein CHS0354_042671 [Potamilus streckersoni]
MASVFPVEAVAFLGAVGAFLFMLVILYLYLNKSLCFADCGGFPCLNKPSKRSANSSLLGTAYAYEEESSSSDSDDEVLKRFRSSMETAQVKRSSSRYSQKEVSDKSIPIRRSLSGPHNATQAGIVKSGIKKEKSGIKREASGLKKDSSLTEEDIVIVTDEPGALPNSTVKEGEREQVGEQDLLALAAEDWKPGPLSREISPAKEVGGSMMTSMTSSKQTSEGSQVFSNQAFETSQSEPSLAVDEHLFDVSDLQQEGALISKCGSIETTFSYNARRGHMEVTIHQAQDIPTKERGGANNTQVRLLLLPTKKQRHKTKVKPGENPKFEETFTFTKISPGDVQGMGIRFRMYGVERMRRERMIGECIIGFASVSLEEPSTHWIILEPRSNLSHGESAGDVTSLSRSDSASSTQSLQHGGMPELLLGLSYNGTTGRLSVEVIKGSNFRNMAMNRPPDTYVKLTLMNSSGQKVTHSKTSVRRGQPNPLFKETFMFQVALFQLADTTLMVSVYNKRSMKKKEMIGWFALGLKSSGEEEASHWVDMRESKGEIVCRWHVLLES